MTKPALLSFHNNGPKGLDDLAAHFDIIKLWDGADLEKALQNRTDDIKAINCTVNHDINADLINRLPNLEMIATFSVGYDHIDLDVCKARNIKVSYTPDVLNEETADTGLALLLATAKRVVESDQFIRDGKWQDWNHMPLGTSLKDKTIGIVGLGSIGQQAAKRCAAFDMHVVYYGPNEKPQFDYRYYDDLMAMARDCDFMMLTCALNDQTRHLITTDVLEALGADGILINIARGGVVDESALIKALQDDTITGAGLDVFACEPNVPDTLKALDNVVLLPHIGSATIETRTKMGQIVVDNLLAYAKDEALSAPLL